MANNAEHREEDEAPAAGDDEDTGAAVAPVVRLEEVAVSTGEEDEQPLLDLKAKLYRFDRDGNQWKERGAGTVKFLKHNVTGKVRLLMRQSRTLKICANHRIGRGMSVQQHVGNEKSCVWNATDFADGELKDELFCIRFASIENCKTFMETFQEIVESQNNDDKQNNEENQNKEEKQNHEENQNNEEEDQNHEGNQNREENQNNGENQNKDKNQNHEGNQNNDEENQNHEGKQNKEEHQNNGENKDASAAARLLEILSVEEHATST